MTTRQRILLAGASMMLVLMYLTPLWNITLEAPQYPEGLGLKIMLTDVQGQNPHDLQNINNLNHYIGMKRIEPDAIPELRIMPWIVAGLMAFGLLAALSGKPTLLYIWTGLFMVVAIAGVVDFWLWAYDYGHNLDTEHAAIKVPGMSYQPPIIGSKQLLNFRAHSWPAVGGWAAFVSLAVGLALSLAVFRAKAAGLRGATSVLAIGFALISVAGCQSGPQPFAWGEDRDDFCRMTITEARYATQVVTITGKAYKFDSIECMKGFLKSGRVASDEIASIWVSDSNDPGTLILAKDAHFVHSARIQSPMGGGLAAFKTNAEAAALAAEVSGQPISYMEVMGLDLASLGR